MISPKISFASHQIKGHGCISLQGEGSLKGFLFLSIDRDSYIVEADIQSGIDFDPAAGRHCIAIGKCCSLAESIVFMIDMNHDYASICQGELSCLQEVTRQHKIPRKASIILQNDVWVGHGAAIMAGVTLHNGCVIAANAVVTKDVPPYAIVGGNPAKILRYRFDSAIIDGLQKIAWWDWDEKTQYARREDFSLPAEEFVSKYLPEAKEYLRRFDTVPPPRTSLRYTRTALFIPDFGDPYPLYRKVLEQYFETDCPELELMIYVSQRDASPENLRVLDSILRRHEDRDCSVILQTGETLDEHILFQYADYFITTRSPETVFRTCLADLYQTKILYGTDEPIFLKL